MGAALLKPSVEGTTTGLAGRGRDDPRARAALFERILERMHRYFARMVRDPAEAEECVQRALVELDRTIHEGRYDPKRSFNAWMWLKARTVWAQWCRERSKAPRPLTDAEGCSDARDAISKVDRRLDANTVLEVVARRLGEEAREAFLLYYEAGLTLEEVAETLGRDRKTVSKRIAEAHAVIGRMLAEAQWRPKP